MKVTVQQLSDDSPKEYKSSYGLSYDWYFKATDDGGAEHMLSINTKARDGLTIGKSFDFETKGRKVGVYEVGKANWSTMSGGGGAGSTPPARAPQNGPTGSAGPSPRQVPTMAQAVAVLRECMEAVHGWGTEAHATTLFLARLRGDIRRNPTQAETDAAEAERKKRQEAELAELERKAAEARAKAEADAARTPGFSDPEPTDDDIPF